MSFTVLANPGSAAANDARSVSFEQASITIRDAKGRALEILDRTTDYTGYGVPNVLQWRAPNTETGTRYDVSVTDVIVNGARRDYIYSFRVTP